MRKYGINRKTYQPDYPPVRAIPLFKAIMLFRTEEYILHISREFGEFGEYLPILTFYFIPIGNLK